MTGRAIPSPTPETTRSTVRRLVRGRSASLALLAGASIVGGFCEAALLVVLTRTGFAVTQGEKTVDLFLGRSSLDRAIVVAFALIAARAALAVAANNVGSRLTNNVVAELRTKLTRAFIRARWSTQQEQPPGRLQELLTTFVMNAAGLLNSLATAVVAGCSLAALLTSAVIVNPAGSAFVILAGVLLSATLRPIKRVVRRRADRLVDAGMRFATTLAEITPLGLETKVFGVSDVVEAKVESLIEENRRAGHRYTVLRGAISVLYAGLAYLAMAGAVAIISRGDPSTFTSLGAVMLVMLRSLSYGQTLQTSSTAVASAAPYVEVLMHELEYFDAQQVQGGTTSICEVPQIEMRSLEFEYVANHPVLRGIDAILGPNEIVGIIGPSGGGKSTLVQLILGLREPTAGCVLVNGLDVRIVDRSKLVRRVTFVPQKPVLISGTVADNIRFFRRSVTDEQVALAARLANFHNEVERLPEQYNSEVGASGGRLSGGQQQRLCIARALVERPDVIILDEPTSALDVHSEVEIRNTLVELGKRMIVIVIAHRMSTLDVCDRIMVIQDGVLRAFGSPTELAQTGGFYREAMELSGLL